VFSSVTSGHTYGFYSVATDNVGNIQPTPASAQASTTVNVLPPLVQTVRINDGSLQRSMVTSITVTFNQIVKVNAKSFQLVPNGGGQTVGLIQSLSIENGLTVVKLTFAGSGIVAGSLADGRYTLRVLSNQVHDVLGNTLDGAGNGQPGDDYTTQLYRFYGDINGDQHVDIADFGQFSISIFNRANYLAAFDFNGDGTIDIADFGQFSIRIFTPLP
jgi:hypothetical protein